MVLPEVIGTKFLYFGYGSNLLKKRILLNNKSAVKKGFGKLEVRHTDHLRFIILFYNPNRISNLVSVDFRRDGWELRLQ